MRHHDHLRSSVPEMVESGQAFLNSRVIGDASHPIFDLGWDIEIHPKQHTLACKGQITN
jgi:hypothetical protein